MPATSDVVSSLPDRPLSAEEVSALNHSEAFTLALPIDPEEAVERETMAATEITETVILGTDRRVTALAYDEGWRVVESVPTRDPTHERFEALDRCRRALADG